MSRPDDNGAAPADDSITPDETPVASEELAEALSGDREVHAPLPRHPYAAGPRGSPPPSTDAELPMGTALEPELESAGRHNEALSDVTSKLSSLGAQVRYMVQRLEPKDLPAPEMGWTDWYTLLQSQPTEDDLRTDLRRRHGGGVFEVRAQSLDKARPREHRFTLPLSGPWRPTTYEGNILFAERHGGRSSVAVLGGDMPATPTPLPTDPGGVQALSLQLAHERSKYESERAARDAEFDRLLKMRMLEGQQAGRSTDIVGLVTAMGSLLLPLLQSQQQARERQEALERERMEREERRHREFLELTLKMQRPEPPQSQVEATKAMLEMVKESAKLEMGLKGELLKTFVFDNLKAMKVAPESPVARAFTEIFKDIGPDVARIAIARFMQPQPQQQPAPAATAAPQQPALPAPPSPSTVAAVRPPPAAPRPIPPGQTIWDTHAPQSPPPAAPAQPATAPAPTPPAPAPEPVMSQQQQAEVAAMQAAYNFLGVITGYASLPVVAPSSEVPTRPTPEAAWTDKFEMRGVRLPNFGGNATLTTLLAASPERFRTALEASVLEAARTDSADASIVSFAQHAGHPDVIALAKEIDAVLASNQEMRDYVGDLLDAGPWSPEVRAAVDAANGAGPEGAP